MSLDTIIASSLPSNGPPLTRQTGAALVLMGGGARTAYQAGVLKGIAELLQTQNPHTPSHQQAFPFRIMVGTSAGALNATYLASQAQHGLDALGQLAHFWRHLRSDQVYQLDAPPWVRSNKLLAAWTLSRQVQKHRALLDNTPLVDTLHRGIDLNQIEQNLDNHILDSLAITASSYTTGVHWTFCQNSIHHKVAPWGRPDRRSEMQPITIEHLMASSAIPFLFRAVPLWVNNHPEFFGDGSMRQTSPLSPAIHLGASKVLAIGVGQPQRAGLIKQNGNEPTAGTIAGHAMASVFNDTLQTDVEQAQRVSQTLQGLPSALIAALPYKPMRVLAIQPSKSMDELALAHVNHLPTSTRDLFLGLGVLSTGKGTAGSAAALASYLLFEPGFVQALIQMGEFDAHAKREELLAFFADN